MNPQNTQQKVMAQLDLYYGRTVGGIARAARIPYTETQAALMALRYKQIAVQRDSFWYLVDEAEAA